MEVDVDELESSESEAKSMVYPKVPPKNSRNSVVPCRTLAPLPINRGSGQEEEREGGEKSPRKGRKQGFEQIGDEGPRPTQTTLVS